MVLPELCKFKTKDHSFTEGMNNDVMTTSTFTK